MGKLVIVTLGVVLLLLVGGGVLLSVWDIPAPSTPVEKVLPDARFPR
jgi:hypothetical protein